MATTISTDSPKLTANIADHADVYGGRALVFDGVADYLSASDSSLPSGSSARAISFWMKPNSISTAWGTMVSYGTASASQGFNIGWNNTSANIIVGKYGTNSSANTTTISMNVWSHIVVVFDGSSTISFYLNGKADGTATLSGINTVLNSLRIGDAVWANQYFNGKITDVKIFNTALTEAQVQELYKKPENTPNAVQDNLVAWYPMIEGNPESPQSIVYDHSEKKLGSSEITSASNTTFSGVTSNDWTSSGTTKSFSNDQMVFTMDSGNPAVAAQLSSSNFVGGSGIPQKFLKVTLDVDSTTTGTYRINNAGGSCSANVFEKNPLTTGINTIYGLCDGAHSYFRIFGASVSTGDKLVINSFDIKEVLMGNHATTNFFGDMSDVLSSTQKTNMDAILESDDNNFDFSDTAGNQVTQSTLGSEISGDPTFDDASNWTISLGTGSLDVNTTVSGKLSAVNAQDKRLQKYSILTVGKVYKVTFVIDSYTNGRVRGLFDDSITFTPTGAGTYSRYFVASNTFFLVSFDGTANLTMTDISVKEITTTKFFPLFGSDEISGNNLKLTNDGTTQAHVTLPFTTVVGKSYVAEIKLTTANMSGGLSVSDDLNENTLSVSSSSGAIITSNTLVATGTTSYVHIKNNSTNNNQYNLYDNLKVREVGVSSSGFETAINEPVVPQVPLMRYNEKIFFNGNNGSGTEVLWNNIGGAFASSEFTLSVVHLGRNTDEIITIFDITESAYTDYIRLFRNDSGRYYLYIENANSSQNIYEYASYANDANFHHIVLTCDGSKWCFYINGYKEREESHTHTTAHLNLSTTDMRVGMIGTGTESYRAVGIIDELSLWNTALTYDEVKELYADSVVKDATTHSKANDHLLGYWRNDGVTTWTDRGDIQAIGFDGSDDNIDFGNDSSLQPASELTVSAWAYMSNWSSASQSKIISNTQSGGYALAIDEANDNNISFFVNNGAYLNPTYALSNLSSGWHHVCATYKNKIAKLYIDGSLVDTATNTNNTNITYNSNIKLFAGAEPDASNNTSQFFNGLLGQIAVFNKELISSEISAIYALGRRTDLTTSYSTNLQGYWFLNPTHSNPDLTGADKILDRSGNGNHGTQSGGVNFLGTNDGDVQGSPDSITIREGLNSNRDGLGFYFTNPDSNVLRLNGSNDFVTIDSTGSLPSGDQSRSITCWIKPSSLSGDQPIIFTGTYASNQMFTLAFLSANPTKISVWGFSNDNTGTDVLTTDNWWYVGVTYDSGTNTLKSYIGGGANNIDPALDINNTSTTNYNTTYGDVRIGRASTQDKYFDGIVDEVKIYNRALSADEILKDFKHQKGKHKND